MTAAQFRMARAALDMTIDDLAAEGAVPPDAVQAIETGGGRPDIEAKLRTFFETVGITFTEPNGVGFDETARRSAKTIPLDALNSANDE